MITEALDILYPGWGTYAEGVLKDLDGNIIPSNAEEIRLKREELITKDYKGRRRLNYPPIEDQLDALFHAGVFPEEMAAQLQAVKDQFPKE